MTFPRAFVIVNVAVIEAMCTLLEYKQLYHECEIDDQCNRISEEVVCKEKYQRKMCICNTGYRYLEVNGTWKCMKGKLFPKFIFAI